MGKYGHRGRKPVGCYEQRQVLLRERYVPVTACGTAMYDGM